MITRDRAVALTLLGSMGSFVGGGCQDYLFEQKFPEKIKEAQIIQAAGVPTPADILFVVDNSGSMADEQERLARNFDAFIREIAGAGDYQIGVVTTDTTNAMERQGLVVTSYRDTPYRSVQQLDPLSCSDTNIRKSCFRGPDPAKRIINSDRIPDSMQQIAAFGDNVRVGSCGAGDEKGLQAMIDALNQTGPGECNEGFLRDGANLVVIIVSDEQDQAASTLVDQYVVDLGNIKSFSAVRVGLVVGSVDGEPASCRLENNATCGSLCQNPPPVGSHAACTRLPANTCPQGEFCNPFTQNGNDGECENIERADISFCEWCSFYDVADCCSAINGSRYVEFARRIETRINSADSRVPIQQCKGTMQGVPVACLIDSICQEDFSATLSRIARELVITSEYLLTPPAVNPSGVKVVLKNGRFPVDGKTLVYGEEFTISTDGARLSLLGENVPREGENIEIYYVVEVVKQAP